MQVIRVFMFVSFLVPTLLCATLERKELAIDDWIRSPSGEFSAAYSGASLTIRNNATATLYPKVRVLAPLLSLKWTGDSKTIITVEHLAGGSCAAVIHFDEGAWHRYDADPAGGPYNHIEVLNEDIDQHGAKITFAADMRRKDGSFAYFICGFNIDGETRARSNQTRKEISEADYDALFSRRENR